MRDSSFLNAGEGRPGHSGSTGSEKQLLVAGESELQIAPEAARILLRRIRESLELVELARDPAAMVRAARHLATEDPAVLETVDRLVARVAPPNDGAFAVVSGLLPDGFDGDFEVMRMLALVIGRRLGDPFQYRQQNGGELVPALVPRTDGARNSHATKEAFGAHSDDAVLPVPFRVRHISLLGAVNDEDVPTGFAPLESWWPLLSTATRATLQMPRFSVGIPTSFGLGLDEWSSPIPLVTEEASGQRVVQFPSFATRGLSEAADRALAELKQAISETMRWIVIRPGTMLMFRNDRGVHARAEIEGERAVMRTYWRDGLHALRDATGEPGPVFDLMPIVTGTPKR